MIAQQQLEAHLMVVHAVPHVDSRYVFLTCWEMDCQGTISLVGDTRGVRRDFAARLMGDMLNAWRRLTPSRFLYQVS